MQADALSRFAKDHVSDREDNRQVQVIGPKHFLAAAKEHFCPEIDTLGDCIRWASLREAEVIEGLKSIDKTAPKALTDGTALWEEDDGFVYYKGKLYVPNCHDSNVGMDYFFFCYLSLPLLFPLRRVPLC